MDVAMNIVDNCIQLSLENGDLKVEQGLETAVIISVFSDQRVTNEELPPGIEFKRGWWGDLFPEIEGDRIGSKQWILNRSKNNLETVAQLENLVRESLQWMLDDGVASAIEVSGAIDENNPQLTNLAIEISRPSGGETDRYGIIWDEQNIKRA